MSSTTICRWVSKCFFWTIDSFCNFYDIRFNLWIKKIYFLLLQNDMIQGTIVDQNGIYSLFKELIQVGSSYYITGLKISTYDGYERLINKPYKVIFTDKTVLKESNMDEAAIPSSLFSLKYFHQIMQMNKSSPPFGICLFYCKLHIMLLTLICINFL